MHREGAVVVFNTDVFVSCLLLFLFVCFCVLSCVVCLLYSFTSPSQKSLHHVFLGVLQFFL
eukprot:m.30303 g.30303  ORF g.30303 m.30303 type:complete len:61 (+) comp9630_c0_seq1:211-393(+)